MRALVLGATGQLGRALCDRLGDAVVWAGSSGELDVRDAEAVSRVVRGARPEVVFNAAAWNDVDGAEARPDDCFAVNATGPLHVARASSAAGALLVHVSSDYVFDGAQKRPYREDDCAQPLSVYGTSKLAGEQLVRSSGCPHIVVRTSALYGRGGSRAKGGSFVERILARARAGEDLRVVGDQVVSPTWAPDLAAALLELVRVGARGLHHVTNSGSCTWHAFAVTILKRAGLSVPVLEVRSRDLDAPARRPPHAILSKERYEAHGLRALRPWSEPLTEHVSELLAG